MLARRELLFVALHKPFESSKFANYIEDSRFAKVYIDPDNVANPDYVSGGFATIDAVLSKLAAQVHAVKPNVLTLVLEFNLGFSGYDVSPLEYIKTWLANYANAASENENAETSNLAFEIVLNTQQENELEEKNSADPKNTKVPVRMIFNGGGGYELKDPDSRLIPITSKEISQYSFNKISGYILYISTFLRPRTPSSLNRNLSSPTSLGSRGGSSSGLGMRRGSSNSSNVRVSTRPSSRSTTSNPSDYEMSPISTLPSPTPLITRASDNTSDRTSHQSIIRMLQEIDGTYQESSPPIVLDGVDNENFFKNIPRKIHELPSFSLERISSAPVISPEKPPKIVTDEKKDDENLASAMSGQLKFSEGSIDEAEETGLTPSSSEVEVHFNFSRRSPG